MLEQCDFIAQVEHRTRSDLIREALRRYLENFRRTHAADAPPAQNVIPLETSGIR